MYIASSLLVSALLAMKATALPQSTSAVPACVNLCITVKYEQAGSLAPTCTAGDISCYCSTATFIQAYANCLSDNCDAADLTTGTTFGEQLCANAGVADGAMTATTDAAASSSASAVVAGILSSAQAGSSSAQESMSPSASSASSSLSSSSTAAAAAVSSSQASASSSQASASSLMGAASSSAAQSSLSSAKTAAASQLSSFSSALSASLSSASASAMPKSSGVNLKPASGLFGLLSLIVFSLI